MKLKLTHILLVILLLLTGCEHLETSLADVGAGTGGAALGYAFSGGKRLPTLIGAASGVGGSKLVQAQVRKKLKESYEQGYNEAMSQSVKQQYWIIQNRQKEQQIRTSNNEKVVPVVIPEQIIDGVIQRERIEYVKIEG